jgi:hypothetical protein
VSSVTAAAVVVTFETMRDFKPPSHHHHRFRPSFDLAPRRVREQIEIPRGFPQVQIADRASHDEQTAARVTFGLFARTGRRHRVFARVGVSRIALQFLLKRPDVFRDQTRVDAVFRGGQDALVVRGVAAVGLRFARWHSPGVRLVFEEGTEILFGLNTHCAV